MSKTLAQIFATNPTTVVNNTDLFYLVQSPYTPGTDAAITGADLKNAMGTGTVNPGLINQLGYYAAAGSTISGLTTANNGTLITSAAGVPSILAAPASTGNFLQSNNALPPSWSASTLTLGGNFTMSGAFTFTGTLTGNTSVTFPTSGTLATTAGTVTNASNIAITDDTTTNASMLPVWVTTNTGFLPAKVSSTKITFNPSTATLTTTTFVGALSGNATTATTATNANNVATTQVSTNASFFPLFVASSTNGNQAVDLGTGLTFNPSTNTLSTTTFSGALSGNATTATTATNSNNSAITDDTTTNATMDVVWVTTNTGNLPLKTSSSKLNWNPSTGTLSATTFSGAFSGTVTNADNINITDDTTTNASMLPVWVTTNTGHLPAKVSSTKITFNPSTATLTTTTFSGALSGNATTATTATNATNTGITDDTTTNATVYPTWVTANTGNLPQKVTSTKLSFNPSTGLLSLTTALGVSSGGTGLTSTTVNQLLYSSASNVIAGLATANNGVLVTNGSGVPSIAAAIAATNLLPLGNSGVSVISSTTYDLSTASGTKTISGLAFQPSLVVFLSSVAGGGTTVASIGFDNGTLPGSVSKIGTNWNISTTNSLVLTTSGGNNQVGHITSFTSDGFVITFTKTGTPTGTATIVFLAFK